jgi:hypothetical protein
MKGSNFSEQHQRIFRGVAFLEERAFFEGESDLRHEAADEIQGVEIPYFLAVVFPRFFGAHIENIVRQGNQCFLFFGIAVVIAQDELASHTQGVADRGNEWNPQVQWTMMKSDINGYEVQAFLWDEVGVLRPVIREWNIRCADPYLSTVYHFG